MTQLTERETLVEALALIDRGLGEMSDRSLMSAAEVADLLLDLRMLVSQASAKEFQN